jgi:hypothetical protein
MDAHKKKVHCQICGKDFSRTGSLRVHEETKHADQNTPEAIAKRLKHNTYHKNRNRDRLASDPIYQEKKKQLCRAYRLKKKTHKAALADGNVIEVIQEDASEDSDLADGNVIEVIQEDASEDSDLADGNVIEVIQEDASEDSDLADGLTDDTQSKDMVSSVGDVVVVDDDSGHVGGVSKQEKKSDMNRKTTGVLHATTMLLTAVNVSEFFEPKYPVPRSKAQRLLEPRG